MSTSNIRVSYIFVRGDGASHVSSCQRERAIGLMAISLLNVLAVLAHAQSPSAREENNSNELIPQNLLQLVHADEVQQELMFNPGQITSLEAFFQANDGDWFRSRLLPANQQRQVIAIIERKLQSWLVRNATSAQRHRLRQLELRSQGTRLLLHDDVQRELGLDDSQAHQLLQLAQKTAQATEALRAATAKGTADESRRQAVVTATEAEHAAFTTLLRPEQFKELNGLLGEPFDTAALKRIYPMAPELVPVEHWINSSPLSLKELRGKILLVHFYAFQCHNCHANFDHYQRWHQAFSDEEVVLIGIQTPETSRERDPAAVAAAAKEKGLDFPIMVDIESANWKAWGNTMWPTVYVVDQQGYLRYWWQGELNWAGAKQDQVIHDLVVELLAD